jgi:hypothetical protein
MLKNKSQYISLRDGSSLESPSGEIEVIPQARVVQLSGDHWGWVWNRPSGVVVRKGEEVQRIPLLNHTRTALWIMYGLSLLFFVLGWLRIKNTKRGEGYE